ncbi:MAG: hypothetical protein KAH56_06545 [Candidatus Krumholzibacteria bacterium]|nr:hypothetical protein [Candidatus Krumholzibacteria bacterium]
MRLFSWSGRFPGWRGNARIGMTAVLVVGLVMVGSTDAARADSLQQLMEQVGPEYAKAYASPFIHTFGPNQNSNLYSTANIPFGKLVFGFGVKVMGTYMNEEDQSFRKVVQIDDLGVLDPDNPDLDGVSGTAVMSGPTIFGSTADEDIGQIDFYSNGVYLGSVDGITGFWETRWAPLFAPEAYIGGILGFKFTLRYLPTMSVGDLENITYMGYGLQWSASGLLDNFPVDLMVGFFSTKLDVENTQGLGQDKLFDSEANSYFVAVSKSWPALTVYGGYALEDSKMDVSYYYEDENFPALTQQVNFSVDGRQESRFTAGVTLDVLVDLNLEAGFGDLTTYSAGVMLGF